MDPLTHTLVGASLASSKLAEKTRYAAPALIIGANLPDVDVLSYFAGGDVALGFRRGWTHGVLALILLPAVLAMVLWLWGRWRKVRGASPPLATGWLFALCYLAVATHPTLDWLNTYGMRWLMPFSDTWYYGDSVFIMDPWLWLILGVGWLVGRRPTRGLVITFAVMATLLHRVVAMRAPAYIPAVITVVALLLLALVLKFGTGKLRTQRAAVAGLALGALYVVSLIGLHSLTKQQVRAALDQQGVVPVSRLMVGPVPANPFIWDVVAESDNQFRYGRFTWSRAGSLELSDTVLPAAKSSNLWDEIERSGQSGGFLRWVRFPWLEIEADGTERRIHLMDARYTRHRASGFGGTTIELPPASSGSGEQPLLR
ncbi:MAG: metal-dependent hydrolase [Thermoanaerobaculia bacterium]